MHILNQQQLPVYPIQPDGLYGSRHFRVYHFEGTLPNLGELLIPHRKDHFLLVFIRKAGGTRQWIDMEPHILKDNAIYVNTPNQVIVKEEFKHLWSTGVAFTESFLSDQGNAALTKLPLIENPANLYGLPLTDADILVVEDLLQKITAEYKQPGRWQQRMLSAYLTVLLTYLSRVYTEQAASIDVTPETQLIKKYQAIIEANYQQHHEVSDYASMLHISAGHLSEVVKSQSGKPAIKHIHDRLVLEARRLLFHTDNSLKDIASTLGFTDASYFNRFFKRETGATPAGYRTQIREMYH